MPVIGECLREALATHRRHGNTVDQAVSTVGPSLIQLQAFENDSRLWGTTRTSTLRSNSPTLRATQFRMFGPAAAKKVKYSVRSLVRRDDRVRRKRTAEFNREFVRGIANAVKAVHGCFARAYCSGETPCARAFSSKLRALAVRKFDLQGHTSPIRLAWPAFFYNRRTKSMDEVERIMRQTE